MTTIPKTPPPLHPARVHEVCGPGATGFAAIICAQSEGQLLWVREGWQPGMLAPMGLAAICDPARILIARTKNQTDTLAVAEEALRDGAVALTVIEITRPLDLREGRRLQLAAKAGQTAGLCLIPEGAGSPASETRWHCAPVPDPHTGPDPHKRPELHQRSELHQKLDSTLMRWEITKNKSGTCGVWYVRWDRAAHHLDVVSPVAQRPGIAAASD